MENVEGEMRGDGGSNGGWECKVEGGSDVERECECVSESRDEL